MSKNNRLLICILLPVAVFLVLLVLWHTPFMKTFVPENTITSTAGPLFTQNYDEYDDTSCGEYFFYYAMPSHDMKSIITLSANIGTGIVTMNIYATSYKSPEELVGKNSKDKSSYTLVDTLTYSTSGDYTYCITADNDESTIYAVSITAESDDTVCCIYAEEQNWLYRREYLLNRLCSFLGLDEPFKSAL